MYSGYDKYRKLIDRHLRGFIAPNHGFENDVIDAIEYIALAPGKRLRPILMLEIADVLGVDSKKILPSACAIEFIHTSSLILDDLPCMDDARMRRSKPAVHIAFNEYTAILASIGLLVQAFKLINENALEIGIGREEITRATAILAGSIGLQGMIAGQFMDLNLDDKPMKPEQVEYIQNHKTTVLFESAVKIACLLCSAEKSVEDRFHEYGRSIGRALQVADDILDVTGTEKTTRKDVGKDVRKYTSVDLYGLDGARNKLHDLIQNAVSQIADFPQTENLIQLAEFIEKNVG